MKITLRLPRAYEFDDLEALCMRSKAHWGYDAAFMELCRPILKVSPRQFELGLVRMAERGFYERMGARYVGDAPSDAIPGRTLPRLVLTLGG